MDTLPHDRNAFQKHFCLSEESKSEGRRRTALADSGASPAIAARKILGREAASGGKRKKGKKKHVMSAAARARIGKATKERWAKFRAAKGKGKR